MMNNIVTKKDVFNSTTNDMDAKVIRKARIARQLLQKGGESVRIIDVKPARENSDKTVFVFKNDEAFQKVLEEVLKENKESRESTNFEARVNAEVEARMKALEEKINALSETKGA